MLSNGTFLDRLLKVEKNRKNSKSQKHRLDHHKSISHMQFDVDMLKNDDLVAN